MLKLRLKKFGRKKQASFRIVLMDSRAKRDGAAIEELGFYNAITKSFKIDENNITKRMEQGAQPTKTVRNLIVRSVKKN